MSQRLVPLLLLVLAGAVGTEAVAQPMTGGARAAAVGGATTALPGEVWGQSNPAAWGTLTGPAVSLFAAQAYGLSELRLGAALGVVPTRLATVAALARTFGFDEFREGVYRLGLARGFRLDTSRRFYVGLTLDYARVTVARYGARGAPGVSVGWLVALLPTLHAGFHATHLNRPRYAADAELPRTFALGLSYAPAPGLTVMADVLKDVRFPASWRGGLEVTPVQALALRVGVASAPVRFATGVGLRLGPLEAAVAAERHYALGWSPGVDVGWRW